MSFEEDIRFWIIRRRDKSVDGHEIKKTNHHHLPLRRRRRGKKPLPFTSGRFKGKRPRASPRLSERGPRDDRRGRTKRRKRKSARTRERDVRPLCIQRYFHRGKKKLKLAPRIINRDERNASHLFTREFALQFLSAETVETDCARKENISSLLLRRSRVVFILSFMIENNSITRLRG